MSDRSTKDKLTEIEERQTTMAFGSLYKQDCDWLISEVKRLRNEPSDEWVGWTLVQQQDLEQCRTEIERLKACLTHIREVAEAAALGQEQVSHWWYGEEAHRALNPKT